MANSCHSWGKSIGIADAGIRVDARKQSRTDQPARQVGGRGPPLFAIVCRCCGQDRCGSVVSVTCRNDSSKGGPVRVRTSNGTHTFGGRTACTTREAEHRSPKRPPTRSSVLSTGLEVPYARPRSRDAHAPSRRNAENLRGIPGIEPRCVRLTRPRCGNRRQRR